jgi:mannose-6-phosphate isomerase-like protein (cupin superfamily)
MRVEHGQHVAEERVRVGRRVGQALQVPTDAVDPAASSPPMTEITTHRKTLVLGPEEGEEIIARGNRLLVKAVSPRVTLVDYVAPAGFPGPPLHVHPGFDEVFIALEGTLSVRVDDEVHEISAGGTAYIDGAVPHTFANPGDQSVHFLVLCAPGGFENYFRAMAAGDAEAIAEVSERFGYAAWPGD